MAGFELLSAEYALEEAADRRRTCRVGALQFRRAVHVALGGRDADLAQPPSFEAGVDRADAAREVDQQVAGDVVALCDAVPHEVGERRGAPFFGQRVAHGAVRVAVEPFGADGDPRGERNRLRGGAVQHGQCDGHLEDAQHRQQRVVAQQGRLPAGQADGYADAGVAAAHDVVDRALESLAGRRAGAEPRQREEQQQAVHGVAVCVAARNRNVRGAFGFDRRDHRTSGTLRYVIKKR